MKEKKDIVKSIVVLFVICLVLGGLAVVLVVVGVALTRKKAKKHDEE